MVFKFIFAAFLVVVVAGGVVALPRGDGGLTSASDAEAAARYWVGSGTVEPARFENNQWEVDVALPDGSLVQVRLDRELQLQDIDEERGPGGSRAHDEVTGPLRNRAILKALAVAGPGRIRGVERDSANELEVGILRPNGIQLEVSLDAELNVIGIERENPEDE